MKTSLNQHIGKAALLMIAVIIMPVVMQAQINYTFAAATGTFTQNAGSTTIIASGSDDALSSAQNIGFTFTYGCNTYTQFIASSNGFMSLGSTLSQAMYTNSLGTVGQGPILAPLWDDLSTSSTGNVNYVLSGTAPNRVLTVEWLSMLWNYQVSSPVISCQVRLYETTNVIEFVYRQEATAASNATASIGIAGGITSTDFYSLNSAGTSPTAVYGTETSSISAKPASNQLYRFTPGNQAYFSSTVVQASTDAVSKCEVSQPVIAVQVVAAGCLSPVNLTQLQFNMNGSTIAGTNTNDVSKIHIYYTGNSPVMSSGNEFVSGGITPATGTITANGSQPLVSGTNYFWITYDMNYNTATTGNVIDAQCTQITVAGVNRTPTVTNPTGARTITTCSVAPGSVKSNLAFWLKANTGTSSTTNATTITTWGDQSGYGRNATSAAAATSPTYYDNSTNNINFNPVIGFNAASQNAAAANFMDITSGGILSTGNNPYAVYAVIKPGTGNATTAGKFLFSGVTNTAGNTFNSFDVRSSGSFNDSWDLNDLIVANQWSANYPSLAAFDFNSSYREMFVTGTSVGTKTGNARNSPDQYCALGCQRAITPNKEFFDGSIAELISYTNTSHDATTRSKIESYLAVKYGITLGHNYLSSIGTTVWNRAANAAYNNNIIGIARDDNSGLSQKQSKSTSVVPDILTLYIGGTKQVDQVNNTGTFASGDRSFFMAANNGDPYLYPGAATEVPPGICCRLRREWLSQKTNFTNTDLKLEFDFNIITPGYSPLNAADLRLLVDADGDFTNATILNTPAITIAVSASVVTITVPASTFTSTPYFTLASASATTPLPVQFISFAATCKDETAQLNWTTGPDVNADNYFIERSSDGRNFVAVAKVKSKMSILQPSYTWADASPLPGTSYYRVKITDNTGATAYSSIVTFADCSTDMVRLATSPLNGTSELVLQLSKSAQVQIDLFDVTGRRFTVPGLTGVQNRQQGVYHMPVSSSIMSAGVYFLSVTINGSKTVYRVIKN